MTDLQTELVQLAENGTEPISLWDAKLWLKVDINDDDDLISQLIVAARQYAEMFCRRSFKAGDQWQLTLNRFPFPMLSGTPMVERPFSELYGSEAEYIYNRPAAFAIEIPMGPVVSVDSITYRDASGVSQTLDPAKWELIPDGDANAMIYPTFGNYWPGSQYGPDAIKITFRTGTGIVPMFVIVAMKQMLAHWYANREAVSTTGAVPQNVPLTAEILLTPYRLLEF